MQIKLMTAAALVAATVSLAACTTKPVVVNTPGPGASVVQVPVLATADIALTNAVKASLQSSLGDDGAGVDVRVEDGTVYLTGRVATQQIHDRAIASARGTPNVRAVVHSGLVVGS